MSPPLNGNGGRQTAEPTKEENVQPTDNRTSSEGQAGQQGARRNSAACFANPHKREKWHADFTGVMVTENLPAGTKCWVSVTKRLDRNGKVFVTVAIKAQ